MFIMKKTGGEVHVRVSEADVANFKRGWPCSGLSAAGRTYVFSERTGELLDIVGEPLSEVRNNTGAAAALSEDAARFAQAVLSQEVWS